MLLNYNVLEEVITTTSYYAIGSLRHFGSIMTIYRDGAYYLLTNVICADTSKKGSSGNHVGFLSVHSSTIERRNMTRLFKRQLTAPKRSLIQGLIRESKKLSIFSGQLGGGRI